MAEALLDNNGIEFDPAIHEVTKSGKPKKAFGKFFIEKEKQGSVDDVISALAGKPEKAPIIEIDDTPEEGVAAAPAIVIDDEPQMDEEVTAPALPRLTDINPKDRQRETVKKMAKEAVSGSERKQVDYSAGYDLSGLDLSGSDLRSGLFMNCDVTDTDFSNARASGINLTNTKIEGSIWNGADLRWAILPADFKSKAIYNDSTRF